MTNSFEPVGEYIFMTAIPVVSVNLKCTATLLQHLSWKVAQSKAAKTKQNMLLGFLLCNKLYRNIFTSNKLSICGLA